MKPIEKTLHLNHGSNRAPHLRRILRKRLQRAPGADRVDKASRQRSHRSVARDPQKTVPPPPFPSPLPPALTPSRKYGNIHQQLRALTLLDALISNAGPRFQRTFADEPLLERLRLAATEPTADPDVKAKLKELFIQWNREYKDTQGLQGISNLHRQFPRKQRLPTTVTKPPPPPPAPSSSPPARRGSPEGGSSGGGGGGGGGWRSSQKKSSSKSKSKPPPAFNLEKEKPLLNQALANSSIASTNLKNALKLINREKERSSEKREVVAHLEACKNLRQGVLRYIQNVESEQWLGGLINAHEELTTAIEMFEAWDKPIDQDSDSEGDWDRDDDDVVERMGELRMGATSPPVPRRPAQKGKAPVHLVGDDEEEEDPDDPFGNQYEVIEDDGTKW